MSDGRGEHRPLRGAVASPDPTPPPDPGLLAEETVTAGVVGAEVPAQIAAADRTSPDDISGMKTARTGGVIRAGLVMAIATLVSRVTGFGAKVVLIAVLGFGVANDAYTLSNTLPNIVFELLIGGVLTSVAIPLLSRARSDPDGGELYTQRLMTAAFVGLIAATGLAIAAAPLLTRLYLGGDTVVDIDLANHLAVLLLPQILFYGLAALFGAILNTKEKFGVPAWAPVVNNVIVIAVGIGFVVTWPPNGGDALSGLTTAQVLFLGLGTTAGIVVQALVMIPALLRSGFRFRWRWGGDKRLTEAGQLLLWAVAYVLVSQAGYIVLTNIAGDVVGGVAVYTFASLLFQLPYGIIGVSLLTAIMPRMSRNAAAGDVDAMKSDAALANRLSIVALTPVAAGMVVLASSLAILAAGYGRVSLQDTIELGATLAALTLGLVPFAMTLVQMRVFYAMKDARTPTLINAVMVGVRIPLLIACVALDERLIIPGMAAATALSYLVGAIVGELWLRHRYGSMDTRRTLLTAAKMTLAGLAGAGAALLAGSRVVTGAVDSSGEALLYILVAGLVGLIVIAAVATLLKVPELIPLRRRITGLASRVLRRGTTTQKPPSDDRNSHGEQVSPPVRNDDEPTPTGPGADRDQPPADDATATVAVPLAAVNGGTAQPTADGSDRDEQSQDDPATGEAELTLPATRPGAHAAPGTAGDAASRLTPGTVVGGRYRLVSLISADANGNWFWRAKDTVLPRDMAVTILPDTTGTSATVARTLRAGRLHHIGLPQTLDVGTDLGQSYVVGQWVDGATVTDLLSAGPLDPDVATSITGKVADAVAEAHRNGIALGAINPSLVRVNFDGQVRISHVIAHGTATPDQDIRAVGALLYLMVTGTWPLAEPLDHAAEFGTSESRSGRTAAAIPAAPTRLGRELPADEVRPEVPEALSALAEHALHPDEPNGIHAMAAIATLLRTPDKDEVAPVDEPVIRTLSAADRRLVRDRRIKLSMASAVLVVLAVLIVVAAGGVTKQVLASVGNVAPVESAAASSSTAAEAPPAETTTAAADPGPSTSSAAAPTAGPVKIVKGTVFDPGGDGKADYASYVDRAFDGNPDTAWLTWVYKQQFPTLKPGVGLLLELEKPVTPATVTVTSPVPAGTSPNAPKTSIEVRSATSATPTLDQTTVIGTAVIDNNDPKTIQLNNAPQSKYLLVWLTAMAPTSDGQFQSKITEVSITGS
ncbi:murein biosynthesis integral membrane protein MurJ [Nakamurella flava]|uniref:Murein biosynthesis integral membrane protein MurJ n=1 Tax=Nakamurella flava TaxID=2576308 RepID=A0A4U6QAP3_9ACTN|nr:murein biosynthesis integral membrane protein MurJ [Nakamurella flava]TKV56988.1 murein biosynthesis integral membrane protein MurJ [Nakamurella flava]